MIEPVIIGNCTLYHGDCRDVLRQLPDNSIDSVCTDPPYALVSIVKRFGGANAAPAKGNDAYMRASAGFMGKQWDTGEVAFSEEFWAEVLRVLKPGGHVAAFGASRGYHRMACAIEDAGFEIRDSFINVIDPASPVINFMLSLNDEQLGAFLRCLDDAEFGGTLAWMYGTGFPKSHNIGLAIDKAERGVPHGGSDPTSPNHGKFKGGCSDDNERGQGFGAGPGQFMAQAGAKVERELCESAQHWQGWGTALKPAFEPIVLARKPLSEGTVAANVLRWGTGALNIDGCRIPTEDVAEIGKPSWGGPMKRLSAAPGQKGKLVPRTQPHNAGRWPANVVHDGSDEVVEAFPNAGGQRGTVLGSEPSNASDGSVTGRRARVASASPRNDSGSAARFFYSAKASKADRDEGLAEFTGRPDSAHRKTNLEESADNPYLRGVTVRKNTHPTVKPTPLMQWLCRLITPPGGTVLDPFMGSGSTGKAAVWEGFKFVGCEREDEYIKIAKARIAYAVNNSPTPHAATAPAAQQPANDNLPQADLFDEAA